MTDSNDNVYQLNDFTTNKCWLKFDSKILRLYGTPTVEDSIYFNMKIQIIAFDGTKNCSDSFNLSVTPSLSIDFSTNSSSFPKIHSLSDNMQIIVKFTNKNGKIILLQSFLLNVKGYNVMENLQTIQFVSNADVLNQSFSYLVYLDEEKKGNNRILGDSYIEVSLTDTLNQLSSFNISKSLIKNGSSLFEIKKISYESVLNVIIDEKFSFRFKNQ